MAQASSKKKERELAKKYAPKRFDEWLAENHPQQSKQMHEHTQRYLDTHYTSGPSNFGKKHPSRTPDTHDDHVTKNMLAQTIGDAGARQQWAAYQDYKDEQSATLATEAYQANVNKELDDQGYQNLAAHAAAPGTFKAVEQELGARDNVARAQGKTGADLPSAKNAPKSKGNASNFDASGFLDKTGGSATNDWSKGINYRGLKELINTPAKLSSPNADPMADLGIRVDDPRLQVAVTGPGLDQKGAADAGLAGIRRADARGRADPTVPQQLNRGDERRLGAYRFANPPTGAPNPRNATMSYSEAQMYLQTLDKASLTRLQQHMALAGYFTPEDIKGNNILWGYSSDKSTVEAWRGLQTETYTEGKSIAQIIQDREVSYAPAMAGILTGTDSSGRFGGPSADRIEVNLSDPDTVKIAARDFFVKALGRFATPEEENALVASIQASERAQGQEQLAKINGINQRNYATAMGGLGVSGDPINSFLSAIAAHESGGGVMGRSNYTIKTGGKGTASGAYQITNDTWNGFGGYKRAMDAPPAVQDAKARSMVQNLIASGQNDPKVWAAVWYLGHVPSAAEWTSYPNKGLRVDQFGDWVVSHMGQGGGALSPDRAKEIEQVTTGGIGIQFPVAGKASYSNDWGGARSGGRRHQGTDIFAAEGTPVVAAMGGTVEHFSKGGKQGHMMSVTIRGIDGKSYFYNHVSDQVLVRKGDVVRRGQQIATVGDAVHRIGTADHLHFSVNENTSQTENPFPLLQMAQKGGTQAALPVGPGGTDAGFGGPLEPLPAEAVESTKTDVEASVQQWAKENRPNEYGAQLLGNAYFSLVDLLSGETSNEG